MALKNATPLGFYASRQIYKGSMNDFGIKITTRHKMKTMSHINEPMNPLDLGNRYSDIYAPILWLHVSGIHF